MRDPGNEVGHAVVNLKNIDDAWRLIMRTKTGLTSRNWTDSYISLDERQIKERPYPH